jgi:hypothetical protein
MPPKKAKAKGGGTKTKGGDATRVTFDMGDGRHEDARGAFMAGEMAPSA